MAASRYGPAEENKEIWVYLEQEEDKLQRVSLELLGKGRQMADEMGWPLCGLLPGDHVRHLADQIYALGVDRVLLCEHPLLARFTVDAYVQCVFQAVMQGKPIVLLFGATHNGRDLAARLAVRLRTGLNADCTDLHIRPPDGLMISEVSGFGGGVLALIGMPNHRPQMATVRPGVFQFDNGFVKKPVEINDIHVELSPEMMRTRILERQTGSGVDLTQAPVLIAGGRGVGANFTELEDLAQAVKGEVGATRPAVDMGYVERERQIGQTGVVCSPKLAICCGISGAFHFVVGIEKADTVISINSDPEAPIFDYSDYCVVGDLHKVLPEIARTLRQNTEQSHE